MKLLLVEDRTRIVDDLMRGLSEAGFGVERAPGDEEHSDVHRARRDDGSD